MSGYLSDQYGASLVALGTPRRLVRSGGWMVLRTIDGSTHRDAIAGYRRLVCSDWHGLADDLADQQDLVSVTGVTDVFATSIEEELHSAFPDMLRPYKQHYVIELPGRARLPHGHRYRLRRALRTVDVSLTLEPKLFVDDFLALMGHLADRHELRGDPQVSSELVAGQLEVPGVFATIARQEGRCIAMTVWYVMGNVAYYHLAASNPIGYAASANYALVAEAIDHLRSTGVQRVDMGANAGSDESLDGLASFKEGWATTTLPTFIGGRIVDHAEYRRLVALGAKDRPEHDYFPAYRMTRSG